MRQVANLFLELADQRRSHGLADAAVDAQDNATAVDLLDLGRQTADEAVDDVLVMRKHEELFRIVRLELGGHQLDGLGHLGQTRIMVQLRQQASGVVAAAHEVFQVGGARGGKFIHARLEVFEQ